MCREYGVAEFLLARPPPELELAEALVALLSAAEVERLPPVLTSPPHRSPEHRVHASGGRVPVVARRELVRDPASRGEEHAGGDRNLTEVCDLHEPVTGVDHALPHKFEQPARLHGHAEPLARRYVQAEEDLAEVAALEAGPGDHASVRGTRQQTTAELVEAFVHD